MATFITLVNFTQEGVRNFNASPERAAAFRSMAQKTAVTIKDIYWTMGAYDAVIILEAADDETAAATMLGLASLGNVRTQTLRGFNSSEVKEIISKVPS